MFNKFSKKQIKIRIIITVIIILALTLDILFNFNNFITTAIYVGVLIYIFFSPNF